MRKRRLNKSSLTPADMKKFKAALLAKRNEILSNVVSMENETLRRERGDLLNMPTDLADMAAENDDLENVLGLMQSERKILAEIDYALRCIEDGTYGICEGNGEQIPHERLEAIPWTRYCVGCAELLEKGLLAGKDNDDHDELY